MKFRIYITHDFYFKRHLEIFSFCTHICLAFTYNTQGFYRYISEKYYKCIRQLFNVDKTSTNDAWQFDCYDSLTSVMIAWLP